MKFELIDKYLDELGLQKPDLEILRQDAKRYKTALLQPIGKINASLNFIGNADQQVAKQKYYKFFELIRKENIALGVTPEYSCPWSVIKKLIIDDCMPKENSLWSIGCESINPKELKILINSTPEIKWIYEKDKVEDNMESNKFHNPLCYIFQTRDNANVPKKIIVIQFKTQNAGGAALSAEHNMIHGKKIFILENRGNNSSRLITLICADVLATSFSLENNLPQFGTLPYLILHIQLNDKPTHINYREYRGAIYGMGRENKEFICLNWARNTEIDNKLISFGGSAYYLKPVNKKDINLEDSNLNRNQNLGAYYGKWHARRAHVFFFNYDEYIFVFETTKVSQEMDDPTIRRRSGPEMLKTFQWSQNNNWASVTDIDSDLGLAFNELNSLDFSTLEKFSQKPLNIERLVYLSIGEAIEKDWYLADKNSFLQVDDTEVSQKITFNQNPCITTKKKRREALKRFCTLEQSVIVNDDNIPDSIHNLRGSCKVDYRSGMQPNELLLNLYSDNVYEIPATGAYIGEAERFEAENIYDKISELVNDQYRKRIVIWYRNLTSGEVESIHSNTQPAITDKLNSNRTIHKTGNL